MFLLKNWIRLRNLCQNNESCNYMFRLLSLPSRLVWVPFHGSWCLRYTTWLHLTEENYLHKQESEATAQARTVRDIWMYNSNLCVFQILPVSIKSLGGSIATLANWLTSFAITMTTNLMLTWSVGGPHHTFFVFQLWLG